MSRRPFFTSLTRISNLDTAPFDIQHIDASRWATGDYVACRVEGAVSNRYRIELRTGRMIDVVQGDVIIGALGDRFATLEATGRWKDMREDGVGHLLTGAGLIGKCISKSMYLPPLVTLQYKGHVVSEGEKRTMSDYVQPVQHTDLDRPCVLLIGSSMSAGKTSTARVIIRVLKSQDLRVVGAKMTGAGRYRDILSMKDAGADAIIDFVDVGLPSTIGDPDMIGRRMEELLSRIAQLDGDVVVIEAGASPLEPYNGELAVKALGDRICFTILCATDPYSVIGVTTAFGRKPDLVTGIATNTEAGIALIERLSEVQALNVLDRDSWPKLRSILNERVISQLPASITAV